MIEIQDKFPHDSLYLNDRDPLQVSGADSAHPALNPGAFLIHFPSEPCYSRPTAVVSTLNDRRLSRCRLELGTAPQRGVRP